MDSLKRLFDPDIVPRVLGFSLLFASSPSSALAAAMANLGGGLVWSAATAAAAVILLIGAFGWKTVRDLYFIRAKEFGKINIMS